MDQEAWIVSAKDPAARERLPDFYEEEGSGVLNGAAMSPDENWILFAQHHGSRLESTYLYQRKEELKFERVFPERFDNEAWKFFSKVEGVPFGKIDANDEGPTLVSFLDWSEDSGRLLLDLHGGLTGKDDLAYRDEITKRLEFPAGLLTTTRRRGSLNSRKDFGGRTKAHANAGWQSPNGALFFHRRPNQLAMKEPTPLLPNDSKNIKRNSRR
jgi:hypothetical protein